MKEEIKGVMCGRPAVALAEENKEPLCRKCYLNNEIARTLK